MSSNNKKKTNEKDNLTNVIVFISTAVTVVAIIVIAVVYSITKPESTSESTSESTQQGTLENTQAAPSVPQTSHTATPTEMIKKYDDVTVTGSVAEADSKVYAYFMSHYQNDYYRVNELHYSMIVEGKYTEYYETEALGYSKQGYIYKSKSQCSYDEFDYSSSIVEIYTPEKSYLVYPDTQSYFAGNQNTQNYTNTVDFPGDTLTTGEININGRKYDYEEAKDDKGISYRYCFNDDGKLAYTVTSAAGGTITTRHVEYQNSVDYSLFKIPEDYMLVEDYTPASE